MSDDNTCPFCGEEAFFEPLNFDPITREFETIACCESMREAYNDELLDLPRDEFVAWFKRGLGVKPRSMTKGLGEEYLLDYGLEIEPISQRRAFAFVKKHHAHLPYIQGWKYGYAVRNGEDTVGVVVVGLPIAPKTAAKGNTLEVRRLAINRDLPRGIRWNAASKLYKLAAKEAARRGFEVIETFTLKDEETGHSLIASGWSKVGESKGGVRTKDRQGRAIPAAFNKSKIKWMKKLRRKILGKVAPEIAEARRHKAALEAQEAAQFKLFKNPKGRWPGEHDKLVQAIRSRLTREMRSTGHDHHQGRIAGNCYVAAEAVYHLIPDQGRWTPHNLKHKGESHWFLRRDDGVILDPTGDRMKGQIDYPSSVGRGFLTTKPSRRARKIIAKRPQKNPTPSIVVRSEAQGLAAIRLPRIVKNFKAALRFKPKAKTAIILPCASVKPFSASVTHSAGYAPALEGTKSDRWIASEPLGIVPQSWENRAPNNDYDFPPRYLRGPARAELIKRFAEFFRLVAPKYKSVIIATPGHHERLLRSALAISPASNVIFAGQRACLDSGSCPPGHIRATTKAYKKFLEENMRNNPGPGEDKYRAARPSGAFPPGTMPTGGLEAYDWIIINTSAGKDSQAMTDYVVELADRVGIRDRLVMAHADLGRVEWQGTGDLAKEHAAAYGLRYVVERRTKNDLLEQIEARGMFPDSKNRYCTSDQKTTPISRLYTRLAKETKEALKKAGKPPRPAMIISALGIRGQESPARLERYKQSQFPVEKKTTGKGTVKKVWRWLPIFWWSEDEVWARIKLAGTRYHKAYDLGMSRLSCAFCVFATQQDLLIAAENNPDLFQEYIALEERIGHSFKAKLSLAQVGEKLDAMHEKGEVATVAGTRATRGRALPIVQQDPVTDSQKFAPGEQLGLFGAMKNPKASHFAMPEAWGPGAKAFLAAVAEREGLTMRRNPAPGRVLLPAKNPILMIGNPGAYHAASRARELDPQDALARMRAERMAERSGISEVPINLEWLRIFAKMYKDFAQDTLDIMMRERFPAHQRETLLTANRFLDELLAADMRTDEGRGHFISRARGLANFSNGSWFESGMEMLIDGTGVYPGMSNNYYTVLCGQWWYYLVTLNEAVAINDIYQLGRHEANLERFLRSMVHSPREYELNDAFTAAKLLGHSRGTSYEKSATLVKRFDRASGLVQVIDPESLSSETVVDITFSALRTAYYIALADSDKAAYHNYERGKKAGRQAKARIQKAKERREGHQFQLFKNPSSGGSAPLRFAGLAGLLPRSGRALDFGCGSGRDTKLLNHAGLSVTGYDPKTAPTRPRGKFAYAQAVYVFNTIKSQKGRRAALKDFKKHLAKGGRWLIAVRATKEIQGQAKRYKWEKSGDGYGSKTSSAWQRGYTPEQLAKFLKLEGIRAAQIWKKHGSVIAVSHALRRNPTLDQLSPLPKGFPPEDRDQMPFDWSNEGYKPPPDSWTPRKNPGPNLHPDAVPISTLPASIRKSKNFKAQMKAIRARYGKATHVIPAQLPPGSPKVVAGIGELGRYHYQAADKAGEPISTWYHDPGDFGEGSNGAPQILAWDAVSGFPVIAFPSDSGMKWTERGIQG
jgi:3'-phosphoadenosine 5'-phosphosulfate sulfotransferase (PAPS reductase)/FAD synthetase